jgi:HPt (histidine-containing phosphotransfer) domain-containing protein
VAAIHTEEANVADAIARADLALCRAKSAGRNRVMASVWSSSGKSTASAIHPGTLAELRRLSVASGHDVVREVVELFLALAPEQLDAIQRAVQAHDTALLRREARALRGAAASTGLTGVVAACEHLERIGSEQTWEDAGAAVDGLLKAYITGRDALSGAAGFNLKGFN